jgi:hypothetical protein
MLQQLIIKIIFCPAREKNIDSLETAKLYHGTLMKGTKNWDELKANSLVVYQQ